MRHLTHAEMVDGLDGTLSADRTAHFTTCDTCRAQLAQLSDLLAETRQLDLPEPSPLFWERLSDRVRVAIHSEPLAVRRPRWFAWPVLAPLAGLAVLVVALGAALSRDHALVSAPEASIATNDAGVDDDAALEAVWALAANLVVDVDAADAPETDLLIAPGSAERAAVELSSDEQAELVRLLQQELGRSGG
jgi:hypothetical protein